VFAISGSQKARHVINERRCVECGVCGRICPAKAVTDAAGAVCVAQKRNEWQKPRVDGELCSACGICVNLCTAGALSISKPAFRGDINVNAELVAPQKCVACALCERHCPIGAITMGAAIAAGATAGVTEAAV
jgi:formate hydrogenlyase subunit 6/NADH:ubiquinone oxidoreductase subunit I